MPTEYSFCESIHATSYSPWCIRLLTSVGRKLGGGVDTESLCGRVKHRLGWDINVDFDLNHPAVCPKCKSTFLDQEENSATKLLL